MNQQSAKFIAGAVIIIAVLVWLGVSGFDEAKSYYVTIPELKEQGDRAYEVRLRLAGNVVPGSMARREGEIHFDLYQAGSRDDTVQVRYIGRDTLPDTLVDEAQAVVTGRYTRDHVFLAEQVQAKCASKYEALQEGAGTPAAEYTD